MISDDKIEERTLMTSACCARLIWSKWKIISHEV